LHTRRFRQPIQLFARHQNLPPTGQHAGGAAD
jgi:hypothetical protein